MRHIPKLYLLIVASLFQLFQCSCFAQKHNTEIIDKAMLQQTLSKVADWQIKNFTYSKTGKPAFLHDYGIDAWTNATFYLGLSQYASITENKDKYLNWLKEIGTENNWAVPTNFKELPKYSLFHADELCIAQTYLAMYELYKDDKMLQDTQSRIDWIIANHADTSMIYTNKQSWTWCDALFMAPTVFAHLYKITGEHKYLDYMDKQFKRTYNHLYSSENYLFFRDNSYFTKQEANGKSIFWGRGNGWVVAGLANLLKLIPENDTKREFYTILFKQMVQRLATLQDQDGFWHASLLDPLSYPSPETSATALITYALAYGINANLINKTEYLTTVEKAWSALTSVVDKEGKLGWVQPIGADPKAVTKDMTAVYGVGAFLLAGTEIYQIDN